MVITFVPCTANTRRILVLITCLVATPIGVAWEGIYAHDGSRLAGEIINGKDPSKELLGPLSQVDIVTVRTEKCGDLRFQANYEGIECLNCRENRAIQSECSMPLPAKGWVLH